MVNGMPLALRMLAISKAWPWQSPALSAMTSWTVGKYQGMPYTFHALTQGTVVRA